MKYAVCLICVFLWLANPVWAQQEEDELLYPVNEATMIGAGGYNLMDTYLTPGIESRYTGWNLRVMDERMKRVSLANHRVIRQQTIGIDGGRTLNGAGTAIDYGLFLDYNLGYHYLLPSLLPGLRVLAGASGQIMGGGIYNTRNTNNPVAAKADVNLNVSAMALYNMKIGNYPLTFRYQLILPFAGVSFAPQYSQSYYEMFGLGNHSGMVHFNSFHNKFAMKHYMTVDFPVGNLIVRAGYLNSRYRTDMNSITSHIISNSFVVGFVKEFVAFGGKRMREAHTCRSAYY